MKSPKIPALLAILFITSTLTAQEKTPVNFDKITAADFSLSNIKADTSFGAVILADVGKSSFATNKKGWFTLVFKRQCRIKLINQKGFDLATVKIPLYRSTTTDDEETLESLKAVTYNLVNGKIEETKLAKESIFKEVQDRNRSLRKFTMPAIKEGSIIDISYTINSDFIFNLQPWSFQGSYPCNWSEYMLNLPEFFQYVFLSTGAHPFHIKESKEKKEQYVIRVPSERQAFLRDDIFDLSSLNTISRWVMKDVPALKEESFTTSIENHLSKIEFQMSGQKFPGMEFKDIMGSWASVALEMLKDKNFGAALSEQNEWSASTLQGLNLEAKDPLEKARLIYEFVQKNISEKGRRGYELSQPLKETLNSKAGYTADINLLLTLLLKKAGLSAFPIILSTRSNGIATDQYPIIGQYNYVISKVEIGNKGYFLDASKSFLGFGKLPIYAYNGPAALIDFNPGTENISPENLTEQKTTSVLLLNDKNSKTKWVGNLTSALGYYESYNIREAIKEKGKEAYINKHQEAYTGEYEIDKIELKELDDYSKSITMKHTLQVDRAGEHSIIYFNPMLREGLKENYFKSTERKYPVELPYKMDESYIFHIQIPEGYVLDEVPKSTRVTLNETDGSFEYIITKSETEIQLRTQMKINKTVFPSDEYEALRGFFDFIVNKHAEQIVFKKK